MHYSHLSPHLPEIVITIGAVLLIGCAAGCVCSPSEEKDDLFHHEVC
jgi:hypothetical protein